MKKVFTIILSLILVFAVTACGTGSTTASDTPTGTTAAKLSGTLEVAGSTSVAPLAQDIADAFMDKNPDVTINIQALGSSAGIKAPVDKSAPIGMSSRNLKDEEKAWGLDEHVIAIDGIAVVSHPDNAVKGLTKEQLKKIYVGEIKNWKDVGGEDTEIIVISREEGSGTRGAFEELVGFEGELRVDALIGDGNGNVKSNLQTNKNAIAYLSLGYIDDKTKVLEIDGFAGTVENIVSGKYPISRPLMMVTLGDLDPVAKAYLDFCMSDEGQKIVAEKYISVKK
ncbi:MAG: phosphate ABC transporter substrate-binding protein [Ruminococcaceae bacterium]|nr:phosphate ABC transporter substrate-binding protein [Oscillospiraceae bacterium]